MHTLAALAYLTMLSRQFVARLPTAWRGILAALALIFMGVLSPSAHAQIAFVSGSATPTGGGSAVSSLTVTRPAGIVAGDLMLVFISGQTTTPLTVTSTAPSGWISLATATNATPKGLSILAQYKVATATDIAAASFTFNISPTTRAVGVVQVFRGVDTTALAATASSNVASATITAPAVATSGVQPVIVAAFTQGQAAILFTPQASMTAQGGAGSVSSYATTGAGPNGVGIQIAQEIVAAGAGSARTATSSISDLGAGVQVALKSLIGNFLLTPATSANPACMPETFTLRARTSSNATNTTYVGTATLSTSTSQGLWSLASGAGTFTAGANGAATYIFSAADNGVATFKLLNNLAQTYTASALDGLIAGTSTAVTQTSCNFLVTPATTVASTCSGNNFTLTARDSANATLTGFAGTATLSTSTAHGTWSLATGSGSFTPGALNSGAASYVFAAGDSGVATLTLLNATLESYTASSAFGIMTGTSATVVNATGGCLGSFGLSMSTASASTCATAASASPAAPILTLTAKNTGGTVYTTFNSTVTLTTSTGHGTWSLSSGAGSFVSGAADSGIATYTFALSDSGVAKFKLVDEHAESMTITANTTGATGSTTESFLDNVFLISPSDVLGYEVVAGRPHAFTASFYKKDATNGVCSVAAGYTGTKSLKAWYSSTGSHPAGAAAPSIASTSTCASAAALGGSSPASANFNTATFSAGVANVFLCTSDVGQYALNLADSSLGFAGTVVSGASSTATARPFALRTDLASSGALSNPAGTASTGSKFVPAQTLFSARVSAVTWSSGQDSVSPGIPDASADLSGNAVTPSFASASTLAASGQTPSSGALGTLSGGALGAASFASGTSNPATLGYSEAGSMRLSASSTNYLGSGYGVPGALSSPVGRFYASSLNLVSSNVASACSAGGFSYMGQSFLAAAQLKAVGAAGGTLANYDSALGYAFTLSPSWRAVDLANGADLASRLSTGSAPSWSAGLWTYSYGAASFSRLATGPDGQYDSLQMGLSGADADGAPIGSMDMSYTSSGICSGAGCNAKKIGSSTRQRFGRLELQSAYGSVITSLRVPVVAMYWLKSATGAPLGWAVNTLDSCTSIPYADISVGAFTGSVSGVTLPSGNLAMSSGKGTIVATRSGAANVSGSALIGINLGSASAAPAGCSTGLGAVPGANLTPLQSNFCSASTYSNNPSSKLIWGAPQGKSGSIVFSRETY
jgi:hypothetical protein